MVVQTEPCLLGLTSSHGNLSFVLSPSFPHLMYNHWHYHSLCHHLLSRYCNSLLTSTFSQSILHTTATVMLLDPSETCYSLHLEDSILSPFFTCSFVLGPDVTCSGSTDWLNNPLFWAFLPNYNVMPAYLWFLIDHKLLWGKETFFFFTAVSLVPETVGILKHLFNLIY